MDFGIFYGIIVFIFVIVFGLGQTYLAYTEAQMLQFRSVVKTNFFSLKTKQKTSQFVYWTIKSDGKASHER